MLCQGILFKEPNPYAGSRPSDIIGLYRKHKARNPNPTARQPNPPRCSRHQVAGRRPDLPGARGGGGGAVSATRPGAAPPREEERRGGGGEKAGGQVVREKGPGTKLRAPRAGVKGRVTRWKRGRTRGKGGRGTSGAWNKGDVRGRGELCGVWGSEAEGTGCGEKGGQGRRSPADPSTPKLRLP
jgi:hypothetical protein